MIKLYSTKQTLQRLLVTTIGIASVFTTTISHAYEPEGEMECIAPSTVGGGWDFTCRNVSNILFELKLIPRTMLTINMPGASGAVSFSHVITKRQGQEGLLIAASIATISQLAQNKYPGDESMVTWIGTIGSDYGVIVVGKNSPYKSLKDLLNAIKIDPKVAKFTGGSAAGGWDHMKVLMLAKAYNIKLLTQIPWLPSHGGGVAITQVIGGHVDVYSGDLSEISEHPESGDLRVLAVLAPERLVGKYANIPTAKEQGADVIGPNWRGFYMPGGISSEARLYWINSINQLYGSWQWKKKMAGYGLMPFHLSGDAFNIFIKKQITDLRNLSQEIGVVK